jgi:hypothetical protein
VNLISTFFGLGTIVASIGLILAGLILAGISVVSAGVWTGPQRFVPLVTGACYFVVLLPTFILAGFGNLWGIAACDLCFALLGLALIRHAADRAEAITAA